jgi:PAP2 superfamily C-terminal
MNLRPRSFLLRLLLTIAALGLWFWTQRLLGSRATPAAGVGDALHALTSGWNRYLLLHANAANALLITSSALIDAFGFFLLLSWLFGKSVRPFLGLVLVLLLRQVMQALCALPPPQGVIWHYPGVPSAFVTYSVASDFFFSGHTAIAVFGATEIARLHKPWLTAAAISVVLFEIAAVIVLRAHYTMDVFTGLIAALWVAAVIERLSIPVDRVLSGAIVAK